ncbi:putative sulfate exporter family transporter, partial [Vibrio furnissii]
AMGLNRTTGHLIASGTAICGGSAIAAVAPAINADDDQTALALGTVFVLNSVALFLFPLIGHALHLDQHTFGTWAAIAIHDTSSVVGAA